MWQFTACCVVARSGKNVINGSDVISWTKTGGQIDFSIFCYNRRNVGSKWEQIKGDAVV